MGLLLPRNEPKARTPGLATKIDTPWHGEKFPYAHPMMNDHGGDMISKRWTRDFAVSDEDVEFLINTLLEKETPMTTVELSLLLIEQRLEEERSALEAKYKDTRVYVPSEAYEVGDRLIFTEMEMATATVQTVRSGNNESYGDFDVIGVTFDEDEHNNGKQREFAAKFAQEHRLNELAADNPLEQQENLTPERILQAGRRNILLAVHEALRGNDTLKRVAGYWFPADLVLETNIGTLHLAEAVLDMAGGGPLATEEIIKQIGGIGDAAIQLQIFSLNLAMNSDDRFEEVGPLGRVLWYLRSMEPEYIHKVPDLLKHTPVDYDDDLLSDEMFDLETELDDEYTDIEFEGELLKATTTLIYPHRRAGTLPLNAKNSAVFPDARTARIYIELIDGQDEEKYDGWMLQEHRYVYGLQEYYTKHRLPVGAYITVERGKEPGQIIVSHEAYKPRTEWIRILTPNNNRINFESRKRAIGAEYDDLIIIGVDDLEAMDKLAEMYRKKSLAAIMREIIQELGKLTPQGTVHAVTLYSAVNVVRRSAPGPIFATLTANPDFEDVGDHYWKLSS
jgi:hypothetical protein